MALAFRIGVVLCLLSGSCLAEQADAERKPFRIAQAGNCLIVTVYKNGGRPNRVETCIPGGAKNCNTFPNTGFCAPAQDPGIISKQCYTGGC